MSRLASSSSAIVSSFVFVTGGSKQGAIVAFVVVPGIVDVFNSGIGLFVPPSQPHDLELLGRFQVASDCPAIR